MKFDAKSSHINRKFDIFYITRIFLITNREWISNQPADKHLLTTSYSQHPRTESSGWGIGVNGNSSQNAICCTWHVKSEPIALWFNFNVYAIWETARCSIIILVLMTPTRWTEFAVESFQKFYCSFDDMSLIFFLM